MSKATKETPVYDNLKRMRLKRLAEKVAQISSIVDNLSQDSVDKDAPLAKRVRFVDQDKIHFVERSCKKDVVGEAGVDNWLQFAKQRQMSAMIARRTVAQLCQDEEAQEDMMDLQSLTSSNSDNSDESCDENDAVSDTPMVTMPLPVQLPSAPLPPSARNAAKPAIGHGQSHILRIGRHTIVNKVLKANMAGPVSLGESSWASAVLKERNRADVPALGSLSAPLSNKKLVLPQMNTWASDKTRQGGGWQLPSLKQYSSQLSANARLGLLPFASQAAFSS